MTGTSGQTSFGTTAARVDAGAANTLDVHRSGRIRRRHSARIRSSTRRRATDVASGATANGSDSDALASNVTLGVTKTDGSATYTPGGTATYVVTVTNTGVSDALDVTVTDPLPAGVTLNANAICVGERHVELRHGHRYDGSDELRHDGCACRTSAPAMRSSSPSPVAFAPGMSTNPLVNTATAIDVPTGVTASGSDSDTLVAAAGLAVTKTDGSATYTPGGTATYTVVVTNGGPSNAANLTVTDNLPAGATLSANAICAATGAATCGTVTGATGGTSFGTTAATLAAGAGNALTFTVPVSFAASLATDPLINTVTATDPSAPGPVSASDSDTRAAVADVGIVKTGPATLIAGSAITYTLTLTNAGPSAANGATFNDNVPAIIARRCSRMRRRRRRRRVRRRERGRQYRERRRAAAAGRRQRGHHHHRQCLGDRGRVLHQHRHDLAADWHVRSHSEQFVERGHDHRRRDDGEPDSGQRAVGARVAARRDRSIRGPAFALAASDPATWAVINPLTRQEI